MKIVKWIVLVLLVVLIVGGIVTYLNLNRIVKRTIETQASSSLNLTTQLGGAQLALFGGTLDLNDLRIGSPQGFAAPHMLTLADADVQVSYGELTDDPVRIASITLNKPKLVIERSGTTFNFQALMSQEPQPQEDPLRLVIGKLDITEALVELHPNVPGLKEQIDIKLPTVSLANIGSGEGEQNGVAIKEVVMQVVTAMAAKAAESEELPPEVRAILAGNLEEVAAKLVNEELKKLTEQAREKLPPGAAQAVENVLKDPGRITKEPGKVIDETLGGFLRGEQKQPATQP